MNQTVHRTDSTRRVRAPACRRMSWSIASCAIRFCSEIWPRVRRVTIQGLTDSLGAGMTPVREAIRRLIAEGALEFQGNRRVSVPVLTAENIRRTYPCTPVA